MTALALIALAGWWRLWDGMSHRGLFGCTAARNAIGVTVALAAVMHLSPDLQGAIAIWANVTLPDSFYEHASLTVFLSVLWLAAVASLSLIAGRTDWDNAGYMALRYGLPGAAAVAPGAFFGAVGYPEAVAYVFACGLAGASYAAFHRIDRVLPVFPKLGIDGWDAYGRLVCGGVIIGGMALL